ncbi:MAG: chromosomal replication initiator protein DnaA [Patescibacteria group bacterium]|nr:chromosomal replication initiator protein DnaA [Patescibacteria group bacterium]MDE2015146.1 chromosomal replication initiator protein DnaA [Patescibacteria group bacterium]MDE2226574.1 chromosomal replication initiator protein DnaA [Patescibacteria group bacterium]
MDLEQLWQSTLGEMEIQLSRANFATWLKNSRLFDKKDGTFYISLPNNFAKEWVENKYNKNLLGIMRNFDTSARKLEFVVANQATEPLSPSAPTQKLDNTIGLEFKVDPETNLNPRYTMQSFVVGPSNELAFAAASSIVNEIGTKYNPFFVYGLVGLGKTHLIQAIGNEINSRYQRKIRPKYVSSEKFTSDIVWGIRNKRMEDMKRKYRDVDVLIIDDIQFIGGKEKTEEEFFHTFNALYEANKQIIISSDRPPQSIPTLEERLRSRFEGGLITDIGYPEYETRVAIIKSKLQETGLVLSDAVVDIIAKKVKKNIRELEGVLKKILFYQDKKQTAINESVAEEIIEKSIQSSFKRVNDGQILKAVAEFFNISIEDLISHNRRKEVVKPRQIAMYLLRDISELSYPYIGEKMGRDHTTAIHSYEKINQEVNKNPNLNQEILSIKDIIFKS